MANGYFPKSSLKFKVISNPVSSLKLSQSAKPKSKIVQPSSASGDILESSNLGSSSNYEKVLESKSIILTQSAVDLWNPSSKDLTQDSKQ